MDKIVLKMDYITKYIVFYYITHFTRIMLLSLYKSRFN